MQVGAKRTIKAKCPFDLGLMDTHPATPSIIRQLESCAKAGRVRWQVPTHSGMLTAMLSLTNDGDVIDRCPKPVKSKKSPATGTRDLRAR